jgi:D-alanyl-D-alanine carboxypeptidase
LESTLQKALEANDGIGVVALRRAGASTTCVAVGHADHERKRPLGSDAVLYLYSISKTYTAAMALIAVDRGLIGLDDEVGGRGVTVRRLLNHTAGLTDYCALKQYGEALRQHPERAWTYNDYMRETAAAGPRFPPGGGWDYSNTGYALLKHVIEQAYEQSFGDVLETEIAIPLGLRRTWSIETLPDAARVAPGFDTFPSRTDPLTDVRARYHPGWVGTGLVASTASEVERFYRALFHEELVSPSARRELTRVVPVPTAYPPFENPSYGLGLIADPDFPGGAVYGHGGSGPGYSTQVLHWPATVAAHGEPVTIVVLYNKGGIEAFETAMALYDGLGK